MKKPFYSESAWDMIRERGPAMFAMLKELSLIMCFARGIVVIVCGWKVFTKAGEPGWACLIPIYSDYVMLRIAGMSNAWLLLIVFGYILPLIGLIPAFLIAMSLGECFSKSQTFGLCLFLLPVVFLPILAFGNAEYQAPAASGVFS